MCGICLLGNVYNVKLGNFLKVFFNGKTSKIFGVFIIPLLFLFSVLTSFYNAEDESNLLLPKLPTLPKK